MKVALASDHAGFDLKQALIERLKAQHEVIDLGPSGHQSVDYPVFAARVARAVLEGQALRGILVCGSGIGMAIAANKVAGIRSCVVHDTYSARVAVEHNDLNVLALGGRVVGIELAVAIADTFLSARFEGGRHQKRLDIISTMEKDFLEHL